MNPDTDDSEQDDNDETEAPLDRDEQLALQVDASWPHLTAGDLCSGPTSGYCDVFGRQEEDGSYSLRFFGEGLEASDEPIELDPEGYATAEETVAALTARGFRIEIDDLPRRKGKRARGT